jgi:multiple sugar transport system permease protein
MNSNPLAALWRAVWLLALMFLFVFPLVWMVSYSLRSSGLPPPTRLELFAPPLAFENYARINTYLPVGKYLLNSVKVAAFAVPLTLITASWAGLALVLLAPRTRARLLALSVALLLVPTPALWVPRFIIFNAANLTDTLAVLIVPALMGTSPFYVLLFYFAFARVPRDVYESARLDGAGVLQTWYLIALPLARPAVIAVAVLSFTFYWSNYVDPLLYLHSASNYTPTGSV